MQKINLTLPIVFTIVLIGLTILWGAGLGGYMITLAACIFAFTILTSIVQDRRNRRLENEEASVREQEASTVVIAG